MRSHLSHLCQFFLSLLQHPHLIQLYKDLIQLYYEQLSLSDVASLIQMLSKVLNMTMIDLLLFCLVIY